MIPRWGFTKKKTDRRICRHLSYVVPARQRSPRPSRLLLTRLRRDARTAVLGRASGVSRASEGRATRTPHRHTRSEDTRGCLSPSPRISSPTGARPRVVSSESSKPNNRLGTLRDASRAPDRPLEPRLCASRRVRSTRGHASTAQSRFSNRPDRSLSPLRADRRSPRLCSSRSLSTAYAFVSPSPGTSKNRASSGGDGTPCSAW